MVSALSSKVAKSPSPKMRDAMRSGWNSSSAVGTIFSPTPTNLIGLCVTARIESAAPPRASPSSFVRTTPSMSKLLLKCSAMFTASCPVIASTTSKISVGLTSAFMLRSSSINSSSIAKRPAVSTITKLFPRFSPCLTASFTMATGETSVPIENTGTSICSPSTSNCLIAAGR